MIKLILSNLNGEYTRQSENLEGIVKLLATDSKQYIYHGGFRDGLDIAILKLRRLLEEHERD